MPPTDTLLAWLSANGATLHPAVEFKQDPTFGLSAWTTSSLPADSTVLSLPFELAVTPEVALVAIWDCLDVAADQKQALDALDEREKLVIYLALHWIAQDKMQSVEWPASLRHQAYVDALPPAASLRTPHYFSAAEFELLRGSSVYGAAKETEANWQRSFKSICQWTGLDASKGFSWDRYLLASTYISSRAFPSRLLSLGGPSASSQTSPTSTEGSEDSHPILLPGIDLLNHVPSHPISWISSPAAASGQISLIHHSPLPSANLQVFNNYGAKPNDELLLAYGFVLPSLSFDTLPLVLGGLPPDAIDEMTEFGLRANERFLLARDGVVSDELLAIARFMCADEDLMDAWEDALEQGKTGADVWGAPAATSEVEEAAAGMLLGMLEGKTRALNMEALASAEGAEDIRPDVLEMVRVYKKGQADILESSKRWLRAHVECLSS